MSEHSVFPLNILVVDDEINIRKTLTLCLEGVGHKVVAVSNSADAEVEAANRAFDMAFVDLRIGTEKGLDLLPRLQASSPWMKIVVITGHASINNAVLSMKSGSIDYLPKPFTPAEVKAVVQRIVETRQLEQKVTALRESIGGGLPEIDLQATRSPAMQRAVYLARKVASTDVAVLIRGETGTGKGVLARAIHNWSARAAKPFGIIACPSLLSEMCESELFGHVKGAFPAAVSDYPGRITLCEGGTLFLDEIGSLPLGIQPKFLHFLQHHEYEHVGEQRILRADVRMITATRVDLDSVVKEGRLREDLFYRLNVIEIRVPSLRQRREDILPIAERMLAFFTRNRHPKILSFTPEAAALIQNHQWPGNIGELRNVIERCAVLATGDSIGPELLPNVSTSPAGSSEPGAMTSLEKLEEQHIRRVLAATRSLEEAAAILGIDTATLWRRRKKYGI
jgi:two-component system, NtrC family, response regulator AlgB